MRRGALVLVVLVGCAPAPAKPPPLVQVQAPPPVATPVEHEPTAQEDEPPPPPDEPLPRYVSRPVTTAAPPSDPVPTPAEKKACAARGGTIEPVCMMGTLECVVRYRDGGKRCTDKKDCTGLCLYEGNTPAPPRAVGACQRTSDPCGCKAPIVNGKVQAADCVD